MTTASQPQRHTNRLIHATSPYLLQHAHNPVDWYPWGEAALERARREDKPIFLSIGYAACHWCHVMEHESFENEAVAAIMNAHFVCIKVDREERPDLDDIYMKATMIYNQGGGGWPMSVFLTPQLEPFFAGTYFPPESRYGRPGFSELLRSIAQVWENRREDVEKQAGALATAVRRMSQVEAGTELIPHSAVETAAQRLAGAFDSAQGGILSGQTNKFPPSMAMDLLLREHHRIRAAGGDDPGFLRLVETTLTHMYRGGIYDHLAGGFARYSTDPQWHVPHFEKMLYDQALVSDIYLSAYQVTRNPLYARIAREILDYVIADLQASEGGYFSARDADSEGVEGKFYVWSRVEIEAALGDEAALFCDYYDVSAEGNWEGHNILRITRDPANVASKHGLSVDDMETRLAAARGILLAIRAKRVPPLLDDKVLTAWNGLMITSMARAARILDDDRYRDSATRAAELLLTTHRDRNGRLLRTSRGGTSHTLAYLEDHAFLIEGLLNLFETTGQWRWLADAEKLNVDLKTHFADDAGGYFFTPDDGETLLVRNKDASDGAIPSGNSVQLMNLLRMSVLFDDQEMTADAEALMRCFAPRVMEQLFSSERMLAGVDFYCRRPREIVIVVSDSSDADGRTDMLRTLWSTYLPNKVVAMLGVDRASADTIIQRVPLAVDKSPRNGRTTAFVCENFACRAPTTDPETLARQLGG
jgi:hypothetical protein